MLSVGHVHSPFAAFFLAVIQTITHLSTLHKLVDHIWSIFTTRHIKKEPYMLLPARSNIITLCPRKGATTFRLIIDVSLKITFVPSVILSNIEAYQMIKANIPKILS